MTLPIGQMYHVAVDNDVPYKIYGNMQDDGTMRGPSNVQEAGPNVPGQGGGGRAAAALADAAAAAAVGAQPGRLRIAASRFPISPTRTSSGPPATATK